MSEEKALHWLTVGYVSPGAEAWIKDCGGQVRELSSEPPLVGVALAYNPKGVWVWSHGRREHRKGIEFWNTGEIQEASTSLTLQYRSITGTGLAEYTSCADTFLILPDEEFDAATGQVKEPGQYETPSALPPLDELDLDDQPF